MAEIIGIIVEVDTIGASLINVLKIHTYKVFWLV
jgi:hypothetical protein